MKLIPGKHSGQIMQREKGDTGLVGAGRPKGSRSKAKLASEVIELYFNSVFKRHPKFKDFLAEYPNVLNIATIEEVIYLVQCSKAIFQGDTNAAHFIINRARGSKPADQTDGMAELKLPTEEITKMIKEQLKDKF